MEVTGDFLWTWVTFKVELRVYKIISSFDQVELPVYIIIDSFDQVKPLVYTIIDYFGWVYLPFIKYTLNKVEDTLNPLLLWIINSIHLSNAYMIKMINNTNKALDQ